MGFTVDMVNIAMIRAREWANKQEAEERAERKNSILASLIFSKKTRDLDMPCTFDESIDDHDQLRLESNKVCRLLSYVIDTLRLKLAYRNGVSHLGDNTRTLCDLLKNMAEKNLTQLFGDARIKEARELAEWWEKHQVLDKERELEEKRQAILSKLTDEEIKILGLK